MIASCHMFQFMSHQHSVIQYSVFRVTFSSDKCNTISFKNPLSKYYSVMAFKWEALSEANKI
jgi:hypothetical protein